MSKTASIASDSASEELSTPETLAEALDTGFLPDNEHYRLTGEFEKPGKKDETAASTKETQPGKEDASAASREQQDDDASKAAASATANPQRTQPQRRESRWEKRERELKEARAEIARLKAAQSSQSSQPETRRETSQPSQAAPETQATTGKAAPKPKIDDVDPKTKQPKYKTWAEYEEAKDQWLLDEGIRKGREESARAQQQTQQEQAQREISQSLAKRFEGPRAKYPDFDEVALSEDLIIPKGSAAETFFLDSPHAGEVLYYLGQHPEILQGFYRDYDPKTGKVTALASPAQVFRKLMEIEAQLTGGTQNSSSQRASSARPVTQASRPPHQVSGKGTVAKEAVEQAVEDADFETYRSAQNARDLARQKRK